jgi:hypothetical protein
VQLGGNKSESRTSACGICKSLPDCLLQRAVKLGASEKLVREEAQKAIAEQHETENKEKEKAFDEINESIGLVEDRNTLKGESSLLSSDNAFSCEWPGYILLFVLARY